MKKLPEHIHNGLTYTMAATNIFSPKMRNMALPPSAWGKFSLVTPWTPPTSNSMDTAVVTSKLVDSSTQTENGRIYFNTSPEKFKSKATAVIALNLHFKKPIDVSNIGISTLTKGLHKDQLISEDPKKSAEYLFAKTIQILVEETENTPEDLIKSLIQQVKENELLVFALNLIKHNGAVDALLCSSTRNSSILGPFCFALDCFLKHKGKPAEAIEAAQIAPIMVDTVTDLIYCMLGSSYGTSFIPEHIHSIPAVSEAFNKLFT